VKSVRGPRCPDRNVPQTDARGFNDDDGTPNKRLLEGRQLRKKKIGEKLGPAGHPSAKKNYGRFRSP